MKLRLLPFLAIGFTTTVLACGNPVDPKKAVVFIDTNFSALEIQAARAAACTRGETFVLLPYGDELIRKAQTLAGKKQLMQAEFNKLLSSKGMTPAQAAQAQLLNEKIGELAGQIEGLKEGQPPFIDAVGDRLKQLAANNVAIKAVAVSGHDGGGSMAGDAGTINKTDFATLMHTAYKGKEDLEAQLDTVLMWGCYTATPAEVMAWRDEFPNLKILAGFYDSGPSNVRPASFDLMKDLLVKSSTISQTRDQARLKAAIRGLTHIPLTFAAMSVMVACNEEYYYSRKPLGHEEDTHTQIRETFGRFDVSCNSPEIEGLKTGLTDQLMNYLMGGIPIPENTGRSPLRSLYSSARSLEHCVEKNTFLDPDKVGLLLFFKGVQQNFFKVFEKETAEAEKDFAFLLENSQQHIKDSVQDYQIELPLDFKKQTLDRQKLGSIASFLSGLIVRARPEVAGAKEAAGRLTVYQNRINQMLYQIDTSCMDFLDWHEAREGHTPKVLCEPVDKNL